MIFQKSITFIHVFIHSKILIDFLAKIESSAREWKHGSWPYSSRTDKNSYLYGAYVFAEMVMGGGKTDNIRQWWVLKSKTKQEGVDSQFK